MSTILFQRVLPIKGANLVATLVSITAVASDEVSLPRMSGTSGRVVQLRRPGDAAVTVAQTLSGSASAVGCTITGASRVGQEVLLVSMHNDPIPAPTGDGA